MLSSPSVCAINIKSVTAFLERARLSKHSLCNLSICSISNYSPAGVQFCRVPVPEVDYPLLFNDLYGFI